MGFYLGYALDPSWNRNDPDPATADEIILRHNLFLGDLILTAGDTDLSARWGWIPLLDFAAALSHAATQLRSSGRSWVDFTENEALLHLRMDGERVLIIASYAEGTASPSCEAFFHAVSTMNSRLVSELETRYPSISANPAYQTIRLQLLT